MNKWNIYYRVLSLLGAINQGIGVGVFLGVLKLGKLKSGSAYHWQTLPGLRMLFGSNAFLMPFIRAIASAGRDCQR